MSVVIPTFNRAEWVCQAIESALAQRHAPLEVLVVDDGSTDGTGDAIRRRFGDRVTYVRQENRGVSAARNRALELATGDFIAFLDSDDLFLPDKLERQVALMLENPDALISHTSYRRIAAGGEPREVIHSGEFRGWVFPDIIVVNPIAPSTVMLRRCQATSDVRFDERLHLAEDLIFWTQVSRRSRLVGLDEELSAVRLHGANAVLNPSLEVRGLENMRDFLARERAPMDRLLRRALGQFHMSMARAHVRAGKPGAAGLDLVRAYSAWPFLALRHAATLSPGRLIAQVAKSVQAGGQRTDR